jgi:hypothetical protein
LHLCLHRQPAYKTVQSAVPPQQRMFTYTHYMPNFFIEKTLHNYGTCSHFTDWAILLHVSFLWKLPKENLWIFKILNCARKKKNFVHDIWTPSVALVWTVVKLSLARMNTTMSEHSVLGNRAN